MKLNLIFPFTLTLVLTLLAPSTSVGHAAHEHKPVVPTMQNWQQHLEDFRRDGRADDLQAAKSLARVFRGSSEQHRIDILFLAAQTAQADHRFGEAVDLLEELLTSVPAHDGARLMLVNTLLVSGRLDRAARECRRLRNVPVTVRLACSSQHGLILQGGIGKRYERLHAIAIMQLNGLSDPLAGWIFGVLADLAIQLGNNVVAERHLRSAYAREPLARYQSTLVDLLLAQNRNREALALAKQFDNHLGLEVKVLVAAQALRELDQFDAERTELKSRFETDRHRGDYTHGREMAEFYLLVEQQAGLAQTIVESYIASQSEPEDLRLLGRAIAN